MKPKTVVLLIVLSLGMGGIIGSSADPRWMVAKAQAAAASITLETSLQQDHPVAWWLLNRIANQLELTQTQREQIGAIIAAQLPTMQPLVHQLIDNRRQWRSAGQASGLTEATARVFAEQQSALMTELIVIKEQMKAQVYTVLTEEQRAKIDALCNQAEDRVRQWFAGWIS